MKGQKPKQLHSQSHLQHSRNDYIHLTDIVNTNDVNNWINSVSTWFQQNIWTPST